MTALRGPISGHGLPRTEEEALAELERCAGTQFDPRVVEAFLEILAAGGDPQGGVVPGRSAGGVRGPGDELQDTEPKGGLTAGASPAPAE
jgi:hypothetical protein